MWASVTQKSQKFRIFGKMCHKGRLLLRDFYKIREEVRGSPPRAKFYHRGFGNVGLVRRNRQNMEFLV